MLKRLFTLNIGNYSPDICKITYPLLKKYCHKIGAEFCELTERKFPEWPFCYEKLQIYEAGKDSDWNLYVDADAMISPDMFDVTEFLPRDTVMHWRTDPANNRWRYDDYFRRDGRNVGSAGWFAVASSWCRDLWAPCDLPRDVAVSNIFPTQHEVSMGLQPGHFIDEYVTSRNIAKFGLKVTNIPELQAKHGISGGYFWHVYGIPEHEKILAMRAELDKMGGLDRQHL